MYSLATQRFTKFGIVLGTIIALILIIIINNNRTSDKVDIQLTSGPFAVNYYDYKIGENIFMSVESLLENDIGRILIITAKNKIYSNIDFNGHDKSSFNKYFKPILSRDLKICDNEELIGEWKIIIQGAKYHDIKIKIIDEVVSHEINNYKKIC